MAADALSIFLLAHIDTVSASSISASLLPPAHETHPQKERRCRLDEVRSRLALWADLNPLNFADKLLPSMPKSPAETEVTQTGFAL